MLTKLALYPIVFLLTIGEVAIATYEYRYDRLSGRPKGKFRHSLYSSLWAGAFEIILLIGTIYVTTEDHYLVIPAALGAFVGKIWTLESRRRKLVAWRIKREATAKSKLQ